MFTLEQPAREITQRLFAAAGRLDFQHLRSGALTDDEWPRLTTAVHYVAGMKMHVDDTAALSPVALSARARRWARQSPETPALVVVDYLQLMAVSGARIVQRTNEISAVSRSLKALAKTLSCPVVALSQLNCSVEGRPNKRPVMSDLRESGQIEQDGSRLSESAT